MGLVGSRYIQTNDPGSVGVGYQWVNSSTGAIQERNLTNTGWVAIGNINVANYGMLPLTGGTMTGDINGVSGWADIDSPDFTGTPTINGDDIVTQNDLTAATTSILAQTSARITAEVTSSLAASSVLGNNIAIAMGSITFNSGNSYTNDVPLPTYSNGDTATVAQCKWTLSLQIDKHDTDWDGVGYWQHTLVSAGDGRTYTFKNNLYASGGSASLPQDITASYIIIGLR